MEGVEEYFKSGGPVSQGIRIVHLLSKKKKTNNMTAL